MTSTIDRVETTRSAIPLRSGAAVPAEAVDLAWTLEQAGVTIQPDADGGVTLLPAVRVPVAHIAALRQHKAALRLIALDGRRPSELDPLTADQIRRPEASLRRRHPHAGRLGESASAPADDERPSPELRAELRRLLAAMLVADYRAEMQADTEAGVDSPRGLNPSPPEANSE